MKYLFMLLLLFHNHQIKRKRNMFRSIDLAMSQPGLKAQLPHLLMAKLWLHYLTCLYLNFFIYKMNIRVLWGLN